MIDIYLHYTTNRWLHSHLILDNIVELSSEILQEHHDELLNQLDDDITAKLWAFYDLLTDNKVSILARRLGICKASQNSGCGFGILIMFKY